MHPEAVLPKARGGMTFKEIAGQLGVRPELIGRLWRRLSLPARSQFQLSKSERYHRSYERRKEHRRQVMRAWAKRNPERARMIRSRSRRKWLSKVAREERCTSCGSVFPWTNAQQQRHQQRAQPIACSRSCALQARRHRRVRSTLD